MSNDERQDLNQSIEENVLKSQESETAHKYNLLKRVISASGSQYRERGSNKRDRGKSAPIVHTEKSDGNYLRRVSNPTSYNRLSVVNQFETKDHVPVIMSKQGTIAEPGVTALTSLADKLNQSQELTRERKSKSMKCVQERATSLRNFGLSYLSNKHKAAFHANEQVNPIKKIQQSINVEQTIALLNQNKQT